MKHIFFSFFAISFLLLAGCGSQEATEHDRTQAAFLDSLGSDISGQQWWRTAVALRINVTTDKPVQLWLLSQESSMTIVYDYKELSGSGTVTMTAPQGQANPLTLRYVYNNTVYTKTIMLSGKPEELIYLDTSTSTRGPRRLNRTPPPSLCGNSIVGNASYFQFTDAQMLDFYDIMELVKSNLDAKNALGLNCNYELESNGPFYITWVNGYEGAQDSRILGYYYHSPHTYADIKYVDLSETHKWDYIDGLAKVQYQFSEDKDVDGVLFKGNTWYDANFDLSDKYGATTCYNKDRVGDDAYNVQEVYYRFGTDMSALRGISFKIDIPEGIRIGFYLRSDEEQSYPHQWENLQSLGIKPYTSDKTAFKGTNFCVENMNVDGNGKGKHRSFIEDFQEVYWMGMEDLIEGGDHDCNDVIFGVVSDLIIHMPDIVDPQLTTPVDPGPVDPDPPAPMDDTNPFPWTIAYEDVSRNPDFDFNDAVIKVLPDYDSELCCVTVMAAGSTSRMYLHYDGPDGDQNLGEIHELMGSRSSQTYINTQSAVANTPFALIDCVPWPKDYTMATDAKRFYIEIQRGTCNDCTDIITLAQEPGKMPEALLVAGEWQWPMEGTHIFDTYDDFSRWARDVTRTRYWEWYKTPEVDTNVSY